MVYNIPAKLIPAYIGRQVIVRSHVPWRLVQGLAHVNLADVSFVQLLSTTAGVDELTHWGRSVPIEVRLPDPGADFNLLYKYSKLLDNHPVRISIPLVPGFSKAVKQAAALNFAVRLEGNQPNEALVEELSQVLDLYLHRAGLAQPIEYFHSLFLSFYHRKPSSLWEIQEEDPRQVCYVTDDGVETISPRFAGADLNGDPIGFVARFQDELLREKSECHSCDFFDCCGGYFKWPDRRFSCLRVKRLLASVRNAAGELESEMSAFVALQRGSRS